jgi:lipid A disaccharide synthetase
MPGDSHQCRRNATRCLALAQRARKPETRRNFALMAETWEKLAAEMESDRVLLATLHEMELGEPSYTLPLALGLQSIKP